ncbi:lipopolysaccharide biosynthesis protein [Pedobacter sp. JY14-1]|uniref:exopolysaccharide transport family protein n=1 Tax=Pedobacter sp. JY14-1 TaxID=3034151 RepID=UPI0023E2FC6E|nr:lipopolysaccharide biosynthesis protein [Pedobacter sp. JY14-1]
MEELKKFLNLLKKNRLLLIIVPVATVIVTYFLVRNIPDSYVSQAQVATGIIDETRNTGLTQEMPQAQQVAQEFSNLVASMKIKKILDQVSYQLILHDLRSTKPFRKPSKQLAALSKEERQRADNEYSALYRRSRSLNLYNVFQKQLYDLIVSMKYDSERLRDKIQVFRAGDSDFISVSMESEDPELSAFVVNTLTTEFIKYYTKAVKTNQVRTNDFLRDLLAQKSETLETKMNSLRDYKVKNRVLNLDEQSKQLYAQIIDYDNKRQEAVEKTSSYAGALNEIDRKFEPGERRYLESALSGVNQSIVDTKDEISGLYDLYYKNDLDEKYMRSIDSLNQKLEREINRSSDAYITNPLNAKQSLVEQKMNLEVQMDISRYSINALERELRTLNAQFDALVPREADVQRLGMDIDIASKEYLDILNKYNESNLSNAFEVKLNVVQPAMAGLPQPSKKMLLVILSGLISGFFCVLVIFIIYYLDNSIITARDLANATQAPVLGILSNLKSAAFNLNEIWANSNNLSAYTNFKQQLRSIRYEIENEVEQKIIVVTSIEPGEGKTMLSLSLAFAWKMTNHKVLLIDGNFTNPEVSKASAGAVFLEDFIQGRTEIDESVVREGSVFILRNKGGDTALLELAVEEAIRARIALLKKIFDVIIVETSALDGMNQTKEWMLFSDGVIAVFKSGQTLNEKKKSFIDYLKGNTLFKGWVINKVPNGQE